MKHAMRAGKLEGADWGKYAMQHDRCEQFCNTVPCPTFTTECDMSAPAGDADGC